VQVNKDAKEAAAAASGKPKAGSPTPRIAFDLEGFREAQLAADAEAGGSILFVQRWRRREVSMSWTGP
jgi:hypothetical protein